MIAVDLPALGFWPVWRAAARALASREIAPEAVVWRWPGAGADLFGGGRPPEGLGPKIVSIPAEFLKTAATVLCHSDPEAPALLYRALVRHQSDRGALANPADPLTRRIEALRKSVARDIHKMHAFVRFRELPGGVRRRFGAWFEPDHRIVECATPFFARRFGDMDWMIATPKGVADFADGVLRHLPAAERPDLPDDASDALWATYFRNIFNPARIMTKAMRGHMPLKYWKNLPETRLIPEMLAGAEARVAAMHAALPKALPDVAPSSPEPGSLAEAEAEARACTACALCRTATQTVWGERWGEGSGAPALMIVGEQPGEREDRAGRPFVGPAGQVLRSALGETGVTDAWLTNAVKHFKFTERGKRRLHQNPDRGEIERCRWWVDLERRFLQPKVTLALGASAVVSLTGASAPIGRLRGQRLVARDGGLVIASWHPSYILRLDPARAPEVRGELVADLRLALRLAV